MPITTTTVPTVRTVSLRKTDTGKFAWAYDDDDTPYSIPFDSEDIAKAWLFTPVVVEATTKPETP